jgi:hypothetical protein
MLKVTFELFLPFFDKYLNEDDLQVRKGRNS